MEKKEQNGYCPTCKKPQERVQICDACVGRRSGMNQTETPIKHGSIRKQSEG